MTSILDVTIHYSPKVAGFWDYLCGRVGEVKVRISHLPVTEELKGDYFNDADFREKFQKLVNQLWQKKDIVLEELRRS